MDVSELKAEIKTWERAFRATHGRDPTIQEIKEQPAIAEKYKLYKKLAKQPSHTRSDEPKTPPRDRPHAQSRPSTSASALISTTQSKSRAVKTEGPVVTSNPFSPVKKKGKNRADDPAPPPFPIPALVSPSARANPFKTPTKSSSKPRVRPKIPAPVLEEDPFPLIVQDRIAQHSQLSASIASASSPTEHPPKQDNAVSRARKRLRGEAVSPSPVKRARVTTQIRPQPALTFPPEGNLDDSASANVGEHEAFIDDTPAKPPPGGKRFKVLFDESISATQQTSTAAAARSNSTSTSLSRTKSAAKGLFGFGFAPIKEVPEGSLSRPRSRAMSPASSQSDEDMDWDMPSQVRSASKIKAPDFSPAAIRAPENKKVVKNGFTAHKATIPRKDDLFALPAGKASKSTDKEAEGRSSNKKRSLSPDAQQSAAQSSRAGSSSLPLLPPSPPPSDANTRPKYLDKGKGRALARKKAKLGGGNDAEDSEGESSENGLRVKELPWSWTKHVRGRSPDPNSELVGNSLVDSEPEFDMSTYRPTQSRGRSSPPNGDASQGTLEVNLPENLRRVLALSPPKHVTTDPADEDKLVRGLLYGQRGGHYDPSRGGEIWGVGEISDEEEEELEAKRKTKESDEDDWEGEPVPWEVAEL